MGAKQRAVVTQRIEWIDDSKGVAILMIAVHHAVLFLQPYGLVADGWLAARDLFAAFPLPMFFLASGVLARRVLLQTWGVLWRRTLLPLLWLYVVWTVLRFAWFTAVPLSSRPQETSLSAVAMSPVLPQSGLWYLHALVLALVLVRLARDRVPSWILLLAALGVSVAFFGPLSTGNIGYEGLAHYFVFVVIGARYGTSIVAAVQRAPTVAAPLAATVFVLSLALVRLLSLEWLPVVPFALSALAVTVGVLVLDAATPLVKVIRLDAVGRASLAVYVTHVVLIGLVTRVLVGVVSEPAPAAVRLLAVPAVVIVVVAGALVIAAVLGRTPLRVLYRLPSRHRTVDAPPHNDRARLV